MDLTTLRLIVADGTYAIDPFAIADALLRTPDLARLLGVARL